MSVLTRAALFLLAVTMVASPAHAYIDPGTGSLILQVIVAGVLAGLFAIKTWWQKVKAFFRRWTGGKSD